MTDPQSPDPTTPAGSPDATANGGASHEPAARPAPEAGGAGQAPAAAANAPDTESGGAPAEAQGASANDESHDGDADGGDESDDAGEGGDAPAGEGAGASAGAGVEGGEKKKRRRRRRKKKAPGAEGEAGAAPAEGGEARPGEGAGGGEGRPHQPNHNQPRQPRPKRERTERERPAFNVGDVVFGKVTDVTDDALFVDLSGKARAIFDLRELTITEDDVEEYTRADKREADEIAAARAANVVESSPELPEASATGENPVPPAAESEPLPETVQSPMAEAAPVPVAAAPASVPAIETALDASSELTPEASSEAAPQAEAAEAQSGAGAEGSTDAGDAGDAPDAKDGTSPQLPRVIMEPGAPFVGLVHNDGGRGGLVVLTHHPKRVQKAKAIAAEASRSGTLVFGLVTGTIKGGVEVDVDGLRAFAPASHVDLRPGSDLSHLVGKRLPFAVTQYAKRGRDVVLSRRATLETEAKERRDEALKNIEIGGIVDGIVRTIVPFGAFIDIGGVEGLVPLSEMSHNRADQPKDVFKLNETCRVKILRLDERGKLWLSRRAAVDDPWNQVAQKYAQGTKHMGKVARLQPFGAFIELEPGIDGLIHSADLSMKRIEHPEEVVKVGQELEVVVASVDPRQHRIALHPAPAGEAANEEPQRIGPQKIVKVVVVAIETGGLLVRVLGATGRNARGFVSAAATGTPRGTELRKLFPVGKQLDVKVVEIDPRRGELKLSIKAMNEDNERNAYQQYRAQVKREAKFGTFADLLAKRNVTPNK